MIESGLRQKVAKLLRDNGFFVQTIETETGPGVPDLWWLHKGVAGWLELKHVKQMPARATTKVFASLNYNLSNEQSNWIDLCLRNLGKADILVGYKTEYFLVPGRFHDRFNSFTETDLRVFKISRDRLIIILLERGYR